MNEPKFCTKFYSSVIKSQGKGSRKRGLHLFIHEFIKICLFKNSSNWCCAINTFLSDKYWAENKCAGTLTWIPNLKFVEWVFWLMTMFWDSCSIQKIFARKGVQDRDRDTSIRYKYHVNSILIIFMIQILNVIKFKSYSSLIFSHGLSLWAFQMSSVTSKNCYEYRYHDNL